MPERALAAPEPGPGDGRCCAPGSTNGTAEARGRGDALNATKTDIGWGHQIRSYVLHPYQMVKDLRTGVETGGTGAVLDGDLDRFLEASLASRIKGTDALAGKEQE